MILIELAGQATCDLITEGGNPLATMV